MSDGLISEWDEEAYVQEQMHKEVAEKGFVSLEREAEFMYVAAMKSGRRSALDLPCEASYWQHLAKRKRETRKT
jgi:hypothetical protein